MTLLFACTIGLSAFLLFLVQPLIAKTVLPWFGGTAAVWTCCMVFCQAMLLAGYAYADWTTRRNTPRGQAVLHCLLIGAALAFMPIIPGETFKPSGQHDPTTGVFLLLAATIGLPYLVLSTTGPLLQAWWARVRGTGTNNDASVYRLYAVSNVASLGALLSYPVLIEPRTRLGDQQVGWSFGFALFALACAACAVVIARASKKGAQNTTAQPSDAHQAPPRIRNYFTWLGLSGASSVLLLAVTTHITQNIPMPMLWVLPLSAYLVSFVLCFDGQGWYWRPWYWGTACLVLVLMAAGMTFRIDGGWSINADVMHIEQAVPVFIFGLFVLCMVCHGELVERKPAPRYLTRFYLMISLGGALGGILVGIVAPILFNSYWELPLVLGAMAFALVAMSTGPWRAAAVVSAAVVVTLAVVHVQHVESNATTLARNFYGTVRVVDVGNADPTLVKRRLMHGSIAHGEQFVEAAMEMVPTTYFGTTSGVGRTIVASQSLRPDASQKVGIVGLGIGTIAAYGRAGDEYRFYEINPQVVKIAMDDFTYMSRSKAKVETAVGDARLVMEAEKPNNYDILVVDAFSGDSIPVHLITNQAGRLYAKNVKPDGVIAFHISNLYLDLYGVVRHLADDLGWKAVAIVDRASGSRAAYASEWVIVTKDDALIRALKAQGNARDLPQRPGSVAWTDDFNNLFSVLR